MYQIKVDVAKTGRFREGLHDMSGFLKTYFELLFQLEIEEMTATEIKATVTQKQEVGDYFVEAAVAQFGCEEPDRDGFEVFYNRALKIVG